MKNGDMPAMPQSGTVSCSGDYSSSDDHGGAGLTKREMFAMHLYSGMLSATNADGEWTGLDCADQAVNEADNLLKALGA